VVTNLAEKKPMQGSRAFIDTNVMVYAYSGTEKAKRQISRRLIKEGYTVISTQVLQEVANTLARKFRIGYLAIEQTLQECILDNDVLHINRQNTVFKACGLARVYQYSFYDSLIIAAALESSCTCLYSEDLQHSQIIEKMLTLINPYR
jgi:predicted nucleic acid-binding protein